MIHPSAIIDTTANIAATATIGPYCVIGPEVTIGDNCILHNHVTVQRFANIGPENEIYPYCVIGGDPQDRKFLGEPTRCEIGARNKIREHVTIHRGTNNGGGVTRIGSDNLIMVAVHVAHDCIVGNKVTIANQVLLAGHVHVHDGANIGGGAGLHHFATVGECAFIGGLARISKDVPPFMIVEGHPAEVRAVNTIAMTRRGYSPEHIEAIKHAFKSLFRKNGAASNGLIKALRKEFADVPAVITLCEAIEASNRGVHGRALEVLRPDNKRAPSTVPPSDE